MGCGSSTRKTFPPDFKDDYLPVYEGKGPFYCMTADACAEIHYANKGIASKEETPAMTLVDLLNKACEKNGDMPAMKVERKEEKGRMVTPAPEVAAFADADWTTWTYNKYREECEQGARALMAMGIEQFGTVGIYGFNSPEWFMAEVSTILCGAKSAGIYPSDSVENVTFKLKHSKAGVLILEDAGKVKRVMPQKDHDGNEFNPLDDLPDLKYIVTWAAAEGDCPKELESKNGKVPIISWQDFLKRAEETKEEALKERQAKIKPGHCCALIYTSGTTGRPKAVMISHDNIIFDAKVVMTSIASTSGVGTGGQERILSYLPLSHVAGMMVDILGPLFITALTQGYCTAYFARPYDLKKATLVQRLQIVKPTIFLGVPRVWEKVMDKLKAVGKTVTGMAKTLGDFSKPKLLAHNKGKALNAEPCNPFGLAIARVYGKKVAQKLGLNELKYGATSAAPIQTHTLEFYGQLNLLVKEVYGMSECSGATTISTDEFHIWGSVGFPLPGTEFAVLREGKDGKYEEVPKAKDIFNASEEEQGELCYRGRHIMMGYLANPDFKEDGGTEWAKKKNEGSIDAAGFLHSGDKGCMDKHGMIKITGRYKELIIGAGGENVAPVPIEANVKKLQGAISNIMMVGDKRKFNIALVTLKVEGATGEEAGGNKLIELSKLVEGVETVNPRSLSMYLTDLV
mmetsp:Transcript_28366/g.39446  ORF Transcript_28366/g.39446 Transcript_28366/m.39446 type:complete len:685 (-) Transcript_28366:755-2809(-)